MKKLTTSQWIITAVCLIIMFAGQYIIPPFAGFSQQGVAVLCIFISTMILYCTVDTLWPSVACIAAVTTNGLFTYSQAMTYSFGNWIVIYCLFVTLLTYALRESGFIKRAAVFLVSCKIARKGPAWFFVMYYAAIMIVGYFVDPITCLLVMSAILTEVFNVVGIKKGDKLGRDMMFSTMVVECISMAATPVSHANAVYLVNMCMNDYGIVWNTMGFTGWGIIMSLIFLVIYMAYLFLVEKPDLSPLANIDIASMRASLPPMGKREKRIVLVYMFCVVLWILPGVLTVVAPTAGAFLNKLGLTFPCLVGTIILVLWHDDEGKPLMDFMVALKEGVSWVTVVLMAGCMLMGTMFTYSDFGVVSAITAIVAPIFTGASKWVVLLVATGMVVVFTNFCSNTVTELLFYTILIPLVMNGTIPGINGMALCATWGLACNIAFMTPTAGGHAAVFAGLGWCSAGKQFTKAIPISLIGILFATFIAYPLATLFF